MNRFFKNVVDLAQKQLRVLYDMAADTRTTRVRLDVSLVGLSTPSKCRLVDVLQGETITVTSGSAFRAGLELPVAARSMRFIEIRGE